MVGGTVTFKTTFMNYLMEYISKKREKQEKIRCAPTTFNQFLQSGHLFILVIAKIYMMNTNEYSPHQLFKKLNYFIAVLNMAFADHYDAQSAIEPIKQIM